MSDDASFVAARARVVFGRLHRPNPGRGARNYFGLACGRPPLDHPRLAADLSKATKTLTPISGSAREVESQDHPEATPSQERGSVGQSTKLALEARGRPRCGAPRSRPVATRDAGSTGCRQSPCQGANPRGPRAPKPLSASGRGVMSARTHGAFIWSSVVSNIVKFVSESVGLTTDSMCFFLLFSRLLPSTRMHVTRADTDKDMKTRMA